MRGSRGLLILALLTITGSLIGLVVALVEGVLRYQLPPGSPSPSLRTDALLGWDSIPESSPVGTGGQRVLFLGDSFTQVDSFTKGPPWPKLAIERLEQRGIAASGRVIGVAGYGTVQAWLKARQTLSSRDSGTYSAAVLLFFAWNDLRDNLGAPGIYYNNETRIRPYLGRAGCEVRWPHGLPEPLLRTQLLRRALLLWESRTLEHMGGAFEPNALARRSLEILTSYTDTLTWDPFLRADKQRSPYVSAAWRETERALQCLATTMKEHAVPLLVVGIDNAYTVDADVRDEWVKNPGEADLELQLKRLGEVLGKLHVDYINALPDLRLAAARSGRKIYNGPAGNLSGHLEPEGNETLAFRVAEWLSRVLARDASEGSSTVR